jgi:hypothetical protein
MRQSAVRPTESKTETVVTGHVEKTDYDAKDIVAGDGELVRNAVRKADAPKEADKKLHWYRVTRGGFIGHDGLRTRMAVGKELHDGAYNISQLKKQGIELDDLGEGPATGPVAQAVAS